MPKCSVADTFHAGFPTKTLTSLTDEIEASFVSGRGMLGCSLTHQGHELLDMRGGLAHYVDKGSTMGIPLLHPWANRLSGFRYVVGGHAVDLDPEAPFLHRDPNGLPIHGLLAANRDWTVVDASTNELGARLSARLDFARDRELLAAFPFPHELTIDIRLQHATLTIQTTLRASGDVAVPVSFGYHPYLRLPDVRRGDWHITLPVHQQLLLDDRMIPTGATEAVDIKPGALGNRVFDTGFSDLDQPSRFLLAGGGRRIELTFLQGYPFAQVYAPAGEAFICFEPMTAPTNALVAGGPTLPLVAPSESYTAAFALTVASDD